MAKRFIDTDFFKSPFVSDLSSECKLLYLFIICDCDHAGVWIANFEVASIYTGNKITEQSFRDCFKGKFVEIAQRKYFFPDFLEHQYPSGLSENNRAHSSIISLLKKYKLWQNKPLISPFKGSKEMEKEMNKEKEKEKEPRALFKKPSLQDCQLFFQGRGFDVNKSVELADEFYDFYESKNWMVGKNKMKDWKASARRSEKWESNNAKNGKQNSKSLKQRLAESFEQDQHRAD